jgi:YbgC/YbaW family acyl-CoA thioester hydrolase
VDYRKPVMFGDMLDIEMVSKDVKKVSFVLDYTIKRQGDVVLKAEILMVCFDVKNKKFAKIEGGLLEYINQIA